MVSKLKLAAHDEVVRECADEVSFPMFLVHTGDTKQELARTCKALVQLVLTSCSGGMRRKNTETCEGFNKVCAQQYVGKYQSCMVRNGRLIVHAKFR